MTRDALGYITIEKSIMCQLNSIEVMCVYIRRWESDPNWIDTVAIKRKTSLHFLGSPI